MRTVPIKTVVDEVMRLRTLNTRGRAKLDMAESIVQYANKRVSDCWLAWDWPEWRVTEERAFRPVWNSTDQWLRFNANGVPDEVFYIPTMLYYQVLADAATDPPIGTLPTDTNFFVEMTQPIDMYIEYEQRCKRPIGLVLGVYSGDPRTSCSCSSGLLSFAPGPNGIEVFHSGNPTVFVQYQRPKPVYTFFPYLLGKTNFKGDLAYDPVSGESFRAIAATMTDTANTAAWRRVPFLQIWKDYVVYGAYADTLKEPSGEVPPQVGLPLAADAEQTASLALQSAIDALAREGQRKQWTFYNRSTHRCQASEVWAGGTVTTLTDVCDDEGVATPISPIGVVDQYYSDIVALRQITASPSLDEIVTTTLSVKSIARIVIDPDYPGANYQYRAYRLMLGAADVADPEQVDPLDYNALSNNKHWERVI